MTNPMYKKGDLVWYQGIRYVVVSVYSGAFGNYYDLGMTEFSTPKLMGVKEDLLCSALSRFLSRDVAKVLANMQPRKKPSVCAPKRVIFSPPATVCFWEDGTKTVVKCTENDTYDPQIGIAMRILKHCCGNDKSYKKLFKAAKEFKTE